MMMILTFTRRVDIHFSEGSYNFCTPSRFIFSGLCKNIIVSTNPRKYKNKYVFQCIRKSRYTPL